MKTKLNTAVHLNQFSRWGRLANHTVFCKPDPEPSGSPSPTPAPAPAPTPAPTPTPSGAPEGFVAAAEVETLKRALAAERETAKKVREMESQLGIYTNALGTLDATQAAELKQRIETQKGIDEQVEKIRADVKAEYESQIETLKKTNADTVAAKETQIQNIQREQALTELFSLAGKPGEYPLFRAVVEKYVEFGENNQITKFKNTKGEQLLVKGEGDKHKDATAQDFIAQIQIGNFGEGLKATLQPYNKSTAHLVTGSDENGSPVKIVTSSAELAKLMSTKEGSDMVRKKQIIYRPS